MNKVSQRAQSLGTENAFIVLAEVNKLKLGDPLDPTTDVGTLIDERAAQRKLRILQHAAWR